MMAMFLRCLRYVCGGHLLEQEGALWHNYTFQSYRNVVKAKDLASFVTPPVQHHAQCLRVNVSHKPQAPYV
jgi:hypothetical protein